MTPLRLAIVTRTFWPLVGAAAATAARLAIGLAEGGWTVTVLTARWQKQWPPRIQFHDVMIERVGPPPDGRWATWRFEHGVGAWLRRNAARLDLVYVFGLEHEARVAMRAAGRRLPVVLRAQTTPVSAGLPAWHVALGGHRAQPRWAEARALVCRDEAARQPIEAAGYPANRIYLVRDGVTILPPRTNKTRGHARQVLADANNVLRLSEWAPLALYLGRLADDRGLEYLNAAWPPIARRWPNARLWFIGEGPFHDSLRRQISGLKLSGRAMLVGRFDHVEDLLAAADVLVHPGPRSSPSLAVAEAMGAGLPVVAAECPGHRCRIEHGRTGLLVPPGNIAALSEALTRLFDEPATAARLGRNAQASAARHFALAQMVDQHVTLFRSIR